MIDPAGAAVRLGHSIAFFIGTAYGSTETAERLAKSVRAMHHTIKGTRPDGARYDADDPDWLRWNYATVVWGLATAHELYHPQPLRGKKIDRYYGEFVRVGHALGGTDLPTTKAETLDCLKSYLPKLAVTHGMAMSTGPGLPMAQGAIDWAIRDTLPKWARADGGAHQPEHRRAHGSAGGSLDRHQRAARGVRPDPRIPSGAGPGEGAARRCRTRCRRTCPAPTRCSAATRSSTASPDPISAQSAQRNAFRLRQLGGAHQADQHDGRHHQADGADTQARLQWRGGDRRHRAADESRER